MLEGLLIPDCIYAGNLYPMPRTVSTVHAPSFLRKFQTYTSTTFVSSPKLASQTVLPRA